MNFLYHHRYYRIKIIINHLIRFIYDCLIDFLLIMFLFFNFGLLVFACCYFDTIAIFRNLNNIHNRMSFSLIIPCRLVYLAIIYHAR